MTRRSKKQSTTAIIKAYIASNDLTAFCRSMKQAGITRRSAIYDEICANYTHEYLRRRNLSAYKIAYDFLKSDLDAKRTKNGTEAEPSNFLQQMQRNKAAGAYKKILAIDGGKIYWVSPVYGLADYNRCEFGVNDEANRRRMEIINAFLNK